MDKTQLNQIIGTTPQPESLDLLNGCLNEHPYFQAAEMLRLIHLQALKPDELQNALNRAAFILPNRMVAHSLLHAQNEPLELLLDSNERYAIHPNHNQPRNSSTNTDDILQLIAEGDAKTHELDNNNLIDQFLSNLPNLQRPTPPSPLDEQPENIDLSASSIQQSDNIGSEQLAEIYIKQGNTQRAIEIFQQLCLKYPEKSSYFAAQIERISKGLNN